MLFMWNLDTKVIGQFLGGVRTPIGLTLYTQHATEPYILINFNEDVPCTDEWSTNTRRGYDVCGLSEPNPDHLVMFQGA